MRLLEFGDRTTLSWKEESDVSTVHRSTVPLYCTVQDYAALCEIILCITTTSNISSVSLCK
uniref:Uncharacterized protein n=1 Tax=Anguilla anguilla TaxID=7936 RepID=A0A0E9W338_ANGAN